MTSAPSPSRRPEPRPRDPGDPRGSATKANAKANGKVRWRRIPGRLILAVCFVVGAAALAAVVLPFTASAPDGAELRCGPAVFEVLMPADPAFDDIAENAACFAPAKTRLVVAGGVLIVVLVVAGVTERRTRRGSTRRDTQWLSSSTRRRPRRRAATATATAKAGPAKARSATSATATTAGTGAVGTGTSGRDALGPASAPRPRSST